MFKKNSLPFGLILGFIAPILSLCVYYLVKFYPTFTVGEFLNFLASNKNQVTAVSVPCLVLNIALFTFYINSRRDKTAIGIFVVTMVYAILALVFKFIR